MTFGFITGAACATVAAVLVTGHRVVGIKTIVKHATIVDVAFTVAMAVAFAGTITGLMVAIMAGLVMALFLSALGWAQDKMSKTANSDSEFDADGNWIYNQAPYV